MPNPKMKSESYQLLGGINQKWSPYALTPMEFLDIRNMDFQTVNSLTERWGSTQFLGQTFPGKINSIYEYTLLTGQSHLLISYSGGIYDGATTGVGIGLSLTNLGITTVYAAAINYCYPSAPQSSGSDMYRVTSIGAYFQGDTSSVLYGLGNQANGFNLGAFGGQGDTFFAGPNAIQSDNTLSYCTMNNYLFFADGNKFLKFDGISTYPVGLPPVLWATNTAFDPNGNVTGYHGFGVTIVGTTLGGASGLGFQVGVSLGHYLLYGSYVNNRGFEGNIWPLIAINANTQYNASLTIAANGTGTSSGFINVELILATPIAYGISAINIYCYYNPFDAANGNTYLEFLFNSNTYYQYIQSAFWNYTQPQLLQTIPASGSTITSFFCGALSTGQSLVQANLAGPIESTIPDQYLPLGFTLAVSPGAQTPLYDAITNYFPRYLETFQGRLFSAGFSSTPSTVWFSDTDEPEGYSPANNFEVRTNDGDYITCIKAYSSRFYIFKRNSFSVLTGDNPNNFSVQEVSDQYGCFNNLCAVVYDDILIFLGQKGVMMWQGAALTVISQKVQPIIDSITYQSALTSACAVHDKLRNQIMFSIPTNGSTTNNLILVYDYLVGAWTKYDNVTPTAMTTAFGYNNTKNAFYGDYNGRVNWFGPSFLADNGVGFSSYIKSRFMHDLGDSTQKMYRRFYLNVDTPGASTGTTMFSFNINFFQDYGSSIVYSTTIGLTNFQNRIDFGISAKSLAFELSNIQGSQALRIHGFTIESRFLRAV